MSLLDQLSRALGGALGSGDSASLVGQVLDAFGQGGQDGLSGLVRAFQENGLGHIMDSWVSTGSNLPVSHDQITQVIGPAVIQQIARATGTSPEALSSRLTEILPTLVDKLTPDGTLPGGEALAQALSLLRGKLQ